MTTKAHSTRFSWYLTKEYPLSTLRNASNQWGWQKFIKKHITMLSWDRVIRSWPQSTPTFNIIYKLTWDIFISIYLTHPSRFYKIHTLILTCLLTTLPPPIKIIINYYIYIYIYLYLLRVLFQIPTAVLPLTGKEAGVVNKVVAFKFRNFKLCVKSCLDLDLLSFDLLCIEKR